MNYRLFHFGSINIYSYGVMIALAFIIGIYIASKYAKKFKEDPQNIVDLCLYVMISSIFGARLFYIISNIKYYLNNPIEIFYLQEGGLIFYGGLILGLGTALMFLKLKKLNIFKYLDLLAPSVVLGQAIGRIGCFLNGCCYGRIVYNPKYSLCTVKFPKVIQIIENPKGYFHEEIIGAPAYLDHLHHGFISENDLFSLPVIPTQLISSIMDFIIFIILVLVFKKYKFNGQVLSTYLIIYSVGRFFIEFLRGDNPLIYPLSLTLSQIISIILFITGIAIYKFCRKKVIKTI